MANNKEYFKINSVVKTMRVIEEMVTKKEFELFDLTQRLGYPKSTVQRILLTLKSLGYVQQNEDNKKYSVSIKLFHIGQSVKENNELISIVQPIIEKLSGDINETVFLLVRDKLDVVVSAKATGVHSLCQDERIGYRFKAYNCASGRSILANLSKVNRESLFRGHQMKPHTPNSIKTYRELEPELDKILRQGYAVEHEEYGIGSSCVAAPIFDNTAEVKVAIAISGPTARIKPNVKELIPQVKKAAEKISIDLGYNIQPVTRK